MKVRDRVAYSARALALTLAGWLVAGPVLAESTPPSAAKTQDSTTVGQVVVQGRSPRAKKALEKAVAQFLHDMGRPGPFGQISRWAEPVCPITAGLTPALDRFVNQRIREIAARVGAPGAGDCGKGGNVMVMFTTKPDQLMSDIREHHEGLLGYHYVGETKSLAAFQPPMKSWYITTTSIQGGDFVMLDRAYAPGPPGGTASRIPPPLQSRFAFALVVVDANLLDGEEIGPVADRIAMLALSKPAARTACSSLPSVMDFLTMCPGPPALGLTDYDEAYLKALYAYKGSELRYFERRSLARQIIKGAGLPSPRLAGP